MNMEANKTIHSPETVVKVDQVFKVFQRKKNMVNAIENVSFSIQSGTFVSIMGASGSGKSTLLHLMAGLTPPTSGKIFLWDKSLSDMKDNELTLFRRQKIGIVFQNYNLLPTMTAAENVCLPKIIDKTRINKVMPRANELLDIMGLSHRVSHRVDELSGGEQQRVAIARALIFENSLLLLDEPTGNLDSRNGEQILKLLRQLATEFHRTIIMVTHDAKTQSYSDENITIHDGKIATESENVSTPEIPGSKN